MRAIRSGNQGCNWGKSANKCLKTNSLHNILPIKSCIKDQTVQN